ncbi:type IV toxin-antitoxin system AbiEi family antitoxin domain-containing protein [Nocardia callitridis]|uniref:Type IV toxin-antitoxin system AbiEi family antitoxin domain-containing protein n=1 Tax=Nocardia callitridis TaxID=648753 RepID=A0ABP9JT58_9NOCA
MRSDDVDLQIAELAASQWGLITTAQAANIGATAQRLKYRADKMLLVRLRQGVYRLAGAVESPQEPIRAQWLALEPQRPAEDRLRDPAPFGVVSYRSAAHLLQLGDLDADIHEFTVPRRRDSRASDVRLHVAALTPEDWQVVSGLPVTRAAHTVADLAAAHTDGGHLATIVRDAITTRAATSTELKRALRPYAHHYGVPIGASALLVEQFIR